LKELQALKARVQQLEAQVKAQGESSAQQGIDPDEFNRIRVKAESTEDNLAAQGMKGLKFSGVIDPTYLYSQRQNTSSFSFLNNFASPASGDTSFAFDNSYFGMAVLDIFKETDDGTRWHLTLAPHKSAGSNYDFPSIVHEASVSIPFDGPQKRWWAGQLPDWSGYEYYFANQNKFITHNMMFDFLAPTFYTGVGTDTTFGKWQIKTAVANLNAPRYNPKPDGSSLKSPIFSVRVDYSKGEFNGWGGALQTGKTTNNVAGGYSQLNNMELDGYFIRGDWTLQGQVNYGTQKAAAFNGGDARWWGLSGLAFYNVTPRMSVGLRADYLNNAKNGGGNFNVFFGSCADPAGGAAPVACADGRNGFGPGMVLGTDVNGNPLWQVGDPNTGANRMALALALNYAVNASTQLKFELRGDRASLPVFLNVKDGSYTKNNLLFGGSVVVSF
ncbi:MAG: DUF3138 family protein, partial [Betaproteobacteria bacterium]|nr:DUF3138 family protein [Betaproteobacteria bacterium]